MNDRATTAVTRQEESTPQTQQDRQVQQRRSAKDEAALLPPVDVFEDASGITLYADQPVRVGELCRFGGTLGTVEEVGLRSTRVRTLDRTVVTIPNGEFSNLQIENLARRDRFRYHPTLGLRYETSPDQIRYILVDVRRLLYAHPKVDSASARIRCTTCFGLSPPQLLPCSK